MTVRANIRWHRVWSCFIAFVIGCCFWGAVQAGLSHKWWSLVWNVLLFCINIYLYYQNQLTISSIKTRWKEKPVYVLGLFGDGDPTHFDICRCVSFDPETGKFSCALLHRCKDLEKAKRRARKIARWLSSYGWVVEDPNYLVEQTKPTMVDICSNH